MLDVLEVSSEKLALVNFIFKLPFRKGLQLLELKSEEPVLQVCSSYKRVSTSMRAGSWSRVPFKWDKTNHCFPATRRGSQRGLISAFSPGSWPHFSTTTHCKLCVFKCRTAALVLRGINTTGGSHCSGLFKQYGVTLTRSCLSSSLAGRNSGGRKHCRRNKRNPQWRCSRLRMVISQSGSFSQHNVTHNPSKKANGLKRKSWVDCANPTHLGIGCRGNMATKVLMG